MEKIYKTSKVKFITDIAIGAGAAAFIGLILTRFMDGYTKPAIGAGAGRISFGISDFETEIPTLSSTFSQIFTKKSCNWLGYIYIRKS